MISITATGFIAEKPIVQAVGANAQKCEFTVVWNRRARTAGEWKTHWERATFVAWGEEAEVIASIVERGNVLSCTGLQETSTWVDGSGQKRSTTRYGLTAWIKHPAPQQRPQDGSQANGHQDHGQAQHRPNHAARPPAPNQNASGYASAGGSTSSGSQAQQRLAAHSTQYEQGDQAASNGGSSQFGDFRSSGFDNIEM